jgi:acetyltransferase
MRYRFFSFRREFSQETLARWTQIDYDREMAFVAVPASGPPETLGVVRAIADPDNVRAEYAIVIRSALKGQGLGHALMAKMIRYLCSRGTQAMFGHVLAHNDRMLKLARRLGFTVRASQDPAVYEVELALKAAARTVGGMTRGFAG